ncbi:hypothetical protein [uncultured Cytophaga sp.]|uniref:hypothetical protein n=1 Tax=uncultured Cytophaga sp. TaxID=160238 RepID=UPI00261751CD|nr:hypothetical protein [uncultured Cytophaga sp.]
MNISIYLMLIMVLLLSSLTFNDDLFQRYNPKIGLSGYQFKKDKKIYKGLMPIKYQTHKNFLFDSTALEYRIEIVHDHENKIHYNDSYSKEEYLKTVDSYYMVMDYVARMYRLNISSDKLNKECVFELDYMLNDSLSKYINEFKIFEGNHPTESDIILKMGQYTQCYQYVFRPIVLIELK